MMMGSSKKEFISLYEYITKIPLPIEKFIGKPEKEVVVKESTKLEEPKLEEPKLEVSKGEFPAFDVEVQTEPVETVEIPSETYEEGEISPEIQIPEYPSEEPTTGKRSLSGFEIFDTEYADVDSVKRIEVEEEEEEKVESKEENVESDERLETSDEVFSEEILRRTLKEILEKGRKRVEGQEDIKRKIIVDLDIKGKESILKKEEGNLRVEGKVSEHEKEVSNYDVKKVGTQSEVPLKVDEQKDKISFMESSEKKVSSDFSGRESKSSKPLIQDIIDRIRADIIARAEIEAKRRIDEAERKAKEIIDNAYKEAEKIINEALSRSLDISRDIEKEAEERGFKAGYDKGYEDGKNKGYEDAYKKTLSDGRYAIEMIRRISDELAYAKERFSDDFPKIVLHLTLVALKTILLTDNIKDEELVIRALKEALDKVKGFKIIRIRLNEKDIEMVKKFFPIPEDVDVVPDSSVQRGDVKIDMREGYFESSIKWREKIIEEVLKGELENLMSEKLVQDDKSVQEEVKNNENEKSPEKSSDDLKEG